MTPGGVVRNFFPWGEGTAWGGYVEIRGNEGIERMTEKMMVCRHCGVALPPATGRGRPLIFCSTACRRASELEIKRINDRLANLERRLSELRLPSLLGGEVMDDPKLLEQEIALQRRRLLDLLSGSEDEAATARRDAQ